MSDCICNSNIEKTGHREDCPLSTHPVEPALVRQGATVQSNKLELVIKELKQTILKLEARVKALEDSQTRKV